jgi:DMSO/TMAO reductase YedYZ molybdopterin-dependent catalytic subunit
VSPDDRTVLKQAALAGLAGSATATLIAGAVHTLADAVEFPPLAIAQAVVRAASGQVESFFVQRIGYWGERLAVIGTTTAFLLSGLVLGIVVALITRKRPTAAAWIVSLLPVWAVSVATYPSDPQFVGRWPFAFVTLPIFLVGGGVAARAFGRLTRPEPITDEGRRQVLLSLGLGTAGAFLGVSSFGDLLFRRPDPGTERLRLASVTPVRTPEPVPGDAAFARIPGLTHEVTSNDAFYIVDESLVDPVLDADSWRLEIGGLVRRPGSMSYGGLKRLPAVERYQTLECVSNKVGGNLMSNAKWVGVPLSEILDRAGVTPGAVEVVFRAAGGYSDSLPIEQAMDDSTLIAIGMNDHVLPRAHGFPARVLSVGTYGFKNPKWLTSIEVVDQPYRGYWEQRGWTKSPKVQTGSRIDVPTNGAVVGRASTIAGVAFAADRGISRVEVSTDGERTWTPAELKTEIGPSTWRLWRYRWVPDRAGSHDIAVRAYDGAGRVQTSRRRAPYPSGSSGYDRVDVTRS